MGKTIISIRIFDRKSRGRNTNRYFAEIQTDILTAKRLAIKTPISNSIFHQKLRRRNTNKEKSTKILIAKQQISFEITNQLKILIAKQTAFEITNELKILIANKQL